MAIARIAWKQLVNLDLQNVVIDILQNHPHKELFLAADRPSEIELDEWLFVRAATWPDWVAKPDEIGTETREAEEINRKFHRFSWHFVNLPYVHPDEISKFDEAAIREEVLNPPFDKEGEPRHALAAIQLCCQRIRSHHTTAEDRAVALSWLLHLIGDVHQPLHTATLLASKATFDPEEFLPPRGDFGGNRLAVKLKENDMQAIELHALWDGLVFEDQPYPRVRAIVLTWINDPNSQRTRFEKELRVQNPAQWVEESWAIAKTAVYGGNNHFLDVRPLPAQHSRLDLTELNAPVLPAGYMTNAKTIAQSRIMLAGYRLADALVNLLRESK